MSIYRLFILALSICFFISNKADAQFEHTGQRAIGTPHNPKVKMSWNRYHNLKEVEDFGKRMVAAHPELFKMQSIGKSYLGNDIWAFTVTDFSTGEDIKKPAFYIQANIHANELQGTEISMYTAWYLAENYGEVDFITNLLKEKTFYILPTINPDGHQNFMNEPNNANTPRSGLMPMDDDGDWEVNEDGMDDLDGDGHITMMRRKNPYGGWKVDPKYPLRMMRAEQGELGEYEMLGYEGIDRDGDGRVNEDRVGYYDPNRDWGWNWQPDYVQGGALKYPFSTSENYAVKEFALKHRNIAGVQSYHNYGGMFLRGPGAEEDTPLYDRSDIAVYDLIGKNGEKVVPGYRYLVTHKDLYSVFGGDVDFFHGCIGAYSFVNEIMTSYLLFNNTDNVSRWLSDEFYEFDKLLLFGDAYVEWKTYDHPQFGEIEIGGSKKNYVRNTPGFLMEEDAHRNMAFTLYHAYHTPKIEIGEPELKSLPGGLTQVTVRVSNSRMIPTHSSHDVKNNITRPDWISISGATVITGSIMSNTDFNQGTEQELNPAKLNVSNIPGMGNVDLQWIVKGNPSKINIIVDSVKGGFHQKSFDLK